MGAMLSALSTRSKLLLVALVVWVGRSKFVALVRQVQTMLRTRRMLFDLPGPRQSPSKVHILGTLTGMVPEGVAMSNDNVNKHFIAQLTKLSRSDEQRNEGLVRLWVLNEHLPLHALGSVFIYDIDLARQILATKNLDDWEKGFSYKVSKPLIGHSVLSTSGHMWAAQRPLIDKGFKPNVMRSNMSRIVKSAREHTDKISALCGAAGAGGSTLVDVHEEMLKVTVDVLARVAFSYDVGSVTAPTTADAPLYHAFDTVISSLENRIRNPILQLTRKLPLEAHVKFDKAMAKLDAIIDKIIDDRAAELAQRKAALNPNDGNDAAAAALPPARAPDLLDTLMGGLTQDEQKRFGGDAHMDRQTLKDNGKALLFAGHDTTAAALTWFVYLLAKHPDVCDRIRAEAEERLGPAYGSDDDLPLDELEKMSFLNSVVLEVLRLYPSAAFTRTAKRDVQLGKFVIPKGVEVLVFPYLIHRDPKNFADPDAFMPGRWTEAGGKTGSEQLTLQAQLARETLTKAYLPFSLGKRNCVGRPLSLVEIRVVVLRTIANFNLVLPTPQQLEGVSGPELQETPAMSLTLNPRGVRVMYSPRVAAS